MNHHQMLLTWRSIVLSTALVASISTAADLPAEPTLVVIGKDKIQALGTSVQTPDELVKLLAQQKVERVKLRPADAEVGKDYERIGKVVYSLSRNGIKLDSIALPESK